MGELTDDRVLRSDGSREPSRRALSTSTCGWLEGVRGFAVGMCPVVEEDFPTGDAQN